MAFFFVLQMVLLVSYFNGIIRVIHKPFLWGDLVTNITGMTRAMTVGARVSKYLARRLVQEGNVHFRRRVESGRSGFLLGFPALEMSTAMAIY